MAEQLRYTWTGCGPTGRSGFQIVAASDGLSDGTAPITRIAQRYCRNPGMVNRPTGSPPLVSFGWANHGDWRVVFNRVGTRHGPEARPEVHCAHVVVAPAAELPTSLIASWFGSQLWWTEDDGVYGRLEPLDPSHVEPGNYGSPDGEQLLAFIEALLMGRRAPIILPFRAADVASLAVGAESAVPGILERSSLSTYQPKNGTDSFDIVGVGATGHTRKAKFWQRAHSHSPVGRATRAVIVGKLPNELSLVASTVARNDRFINERRFVVAVDCLLAIDRGEKIRFTPALPILDSPPALAFVLSRPAGLLMVSNALAGNIDYAWERIGALADAVAEEHLAALGASLGRLIADEDLISHLGSYLQRAAETSLQFEAGIEAAVLSAGKIRPSLLEDVDPPGCLFLLRHLHHSGVDDMLVDRLIKNISTAGLIIVAADDLPTAWRGAAAAQFVSSGVDPSPLVDLLLSDEKLAVGFVRSLPSIGLLINLLNDCWWTEARDLSLIVAPSLEQSASFAVATAMLERMPLRRRIEFFTDYLNGHGAEPLDLVNFKWASLASGLVAQAVIDRSLDTSGKVFLTTAERRLLTSAADERTSVWLSIGSVMGQHRPQAAELVHNTKMAFAAHLIESRAALVLVLEQTIAECKTAAQVGELATTIFGAVSLSGEMYVNNIVASALRQGRVTTRSAVLKYVGQLLTASDTESDWTGRATNQELYLLLIELEDSLPQDYRDSIQKELAPTKRTPRWWKSILGPADP